MSGTTTPMQTSAQLPVVCTVTQEVIITCIDGIAVCLLVLLKIFRRAFTQDPVMAFLVQREGSQRAGVSDREQRKAHTRSGRVGTFQQNIRQGA